MDQFGLKIAHIIHISRIVAGKRHKLPMPGDSPERIRLRRTLQNSAGVISGALSALAYKRSVLPFVWALRERGQSGSNKYVIKITITSHAGRVKRRILQLIFRLSR